MRAQRPRSAERFLKGASSGYPGDIWRYARWKIVAPARSAGIDAIDGPFPSFKDPDSYREEARGALLLGFVGKWAIHPAQIKPAIEVFTPNRAVADKARAMARADAEAEAEGPSSIAIDGDMVDAAVIRVNQDMLPRADLAGI